MAIVSAARSFCCLFFKVVFFITPQRQVMQQSPYSTPNIHTAALTHNQSFTGKWSAHQGVVLFSYHSLVPFPRFHPTVRSLLPFHFPWVHQSVGALLPRVQSFGWPDPHTWCNTHQEGHEDFKHLHCHIGIICRIVENGPVRDLVEVTGNDTRCWDSVQHRKDTNFDHQSFQFVSFGSIFLEIRPDFKQGHESCCNE